MARQRFIWPSLWTDPTIGQLSAPARILFIGCFSNADDDGRLEGDPAYLKATVFPHDTLNVSAVQSFRDEVVEKCRNLVLYEYDGREYLAFTKWGEFQKPKYPRPSKLPPPPEKKPRKPRSSGNPPEPFREPSGKPSGEDLAEPGQKSSGSSPEALREPSGSLPPWVGKGWVGLDRETPAPSPEANYDSDHADPFTDTEPPHTTNVNGSGTGAGNVETLKSEVEQLAAKHASTQTADDEVPF